MPTKKFPVNSRDGRNCQDYPGIKKKSRRGKDMKITPALLGVKMCFPYNLHHQQASGFELAVAGMEDVGKAAQFKWPCQCIT